MAENKKGFVLYADQIGLFSQLPDEKAGQLIKHIYAYVNDKNPTTDDLVINIAFEPIKQQLKRDLKKFEEAKKQRSEAGKRSAELRKAQRNATKPTTVETRSTKSTVIVKDNVTVKDKVNVINKKNIIERKAEFKNSLHPFLEIYSKDLLNDFYFYWTEHGEKDKKMRFEKQTSFSIERRLATWKKNEAKFGSKETESFTDFGNKLLEKYKA